MLLYKISHINHYIVLLISIAFLFNPIISIAQKDTLKGTNSFKNHGDTLNENHLVNNDDTLVLKSVKNDSIRVRKRHSPTKASLFSTFVPGLGQFYNKKYWKLPIIYGGIGYLGYSSIEHNSNYQDYKQAYIYRTDTSAATIAADVFNTYTDADLESIMNQYRRARDFNYVIIGVIYIFNIIDASVDAHLFDYDVSDDLSLKINPDYMVMNNHRDNYVGLRLTFTFK